MDSVLITLSFLYASTYFMFYFLSAPIKILTFFSILNGSREVSLANRTDFWEWEKEITAPTLTCKLFWALTKNNKTQWGTHNYVNEFHQKMKQMLIAFKFDDNYPNTTPSGSMFCCVGGDAELTLIQNVKDI